MASGDGFPVPTRQASHIIAGFPTEVLVQLFQDRTVVFLNQGKVGKMIQISPPTSNRRRATQRRDPFGDEEEQEQHEASYQTAHESLNGTFLPPPDASSTVTTLFGSSKSETARQMETLYAAQIAAILFARSRQPQAEEGDDASAASAVREARPVIVALGLKSAFLEGKAAEAGQSLDSDLMQEQRTRFKSVMDLVGSLF